MSTARARPVLAAAAAAALLLAGCADEEVPASTEDPQTDQQTQDTELAPDATSTAEVGGQEHATRAITTAEGVATGGRAVELDRDDDETFDVTVQADEVEHEVTVSIDGSRVVEQEEDGDVDEEDRERLTTATVTMVEALETAMSDRSGGVTEIDLDTQDDAVVWEVTVESDGGEEEIVVDAASGEVL